MTNSIYMLIPMDFINSKKVKYQEETGITDVKFDTNAIDKFKKCLNQFNSIDGYYRVCDLEEAWETANSENVYEKRGIIFI